MSGVRPGFTGTGYVHSWVAAQPALTTDLKVKVPGVYRIRLRVLSTSGALLRISFDAVEFQTTEVTVAIPIADGDSWESATTVTIDVLLEGSGDTMTVRPVGTGSVDFDHIRVSRLVELSGNASRTSSD